MDVGSALDGRLEESPTGETSTEEFAKLRIALRLESGKRAGVLGPASPLR
jgi:hypothetical protein